MIKFLVSGKQGDHLPVTTSAGAPDHRLMGAAWAALHKGYRGNKFAGPNKQAAIDKLTAMYKKEKLATPQEAWAIRGTSIWVEADGTPQASSFDALRQRIYSALQKAIDAGEDMDLDGDNDAYSWACVCDVFPSTFVYSLESNMFQAEYHDTALGVVIGTPYPVEMSYTRIEKPVYNEESTRLVVAAVTQLSESYDAAAGKLRVRIIEAGFNKSKERYYPADVLRRDMEVFEGAKMFTNHQTEAEQRARPEGDVRNWVANLQGVWAEGDSLYGYAVVHDADFKTKLTELDKNGLIKEMGVSIRAIGEASTRTVEEQRTNYVERLIAARSVDFVTYAGAGGQVEAIESATVADSTDLELLNLTQLCEARPDLVTLIETKGKEKAMKTAEEQLQEANTRLAAVNTQLATVTAERDTLKTKVTEAETKANKAAANVELARLMTESKLPKAAKDRLQKRFAEAVVIDGMKEAFAEEADYLKSLGQPVAVRKANGTADNANEEESLQESGQKEEDEATVTKQRKSLVENYQKMGMSKEAAEAAVGTI